MNAALPADAPRNPNWPYRFAAKTRRLAMLGYLLMGLLACWAWVKDPGVPGTIAGSLTCAMVICLGGIKLGSPQKAIERETAGLQGTSFIVVNGAFLLCAFGLFFWRESQVPDPAGTQMIGVATFAVCVILVLSFVELIWGADLRSFFIKGRYSWSPAKKYLAFCGLSLSIISLTAAWIPSLISTPQMAAGRFAANTVWNFEEKQHLSRHLVAQRSAFLTGIRREGDLIKAQITAQTPVTPFKLKSESAKEFIEAKSSAQKINETSTPHVEIEVEVTFERSGLMGWRMIDDGGLEQKLAQAQQSYEGGSAKIVKRPHLSGDTYTYDALKSLSDPIPSVMWTISLMCVACMFALASGGDLRGVPRGMLSFIGSGSQAWMIAFAGVSSALANYSGLLSFVSR